MSDLDFYTMIIDNIINDNTRYSNKFWMSDLLNIINSYEFNFDVFEKVLDINPNNKTVFLNKLSEISRCLSVNKQKQIAYIMRKNKIEYNINYPNKIKEALEIINRLPDDFDNKNLFELVDLFCLFFDNSDDNIFCENKIELNIINNTNNMWIRIYNWLLSNNGLNNYNILKKIIPLVSGRFRVIMLKRYLHDIWLKNTFFDSNILIQFRDNDNEEFIIYRQCLNENENKDTLLVSLFADCILTTIKSNGSYIQTFNGILDLISQKCDETKTDSLNNLNYFLPTCSGGILNNNFKGFIKYDVICKLNKIKLSDENHINDVIEKILIKCNAQKQDNLWSFVNYPKNVQTIKMFYPKKINYPFPNDENPIYETIKIDENDFSIPYFKKSIVNLAKQYKFDSDVFFFNSLRFTNKDIYTWILSQFSYPLGLEIYPNKDIICGIEYDIFGIKNDIENKINIELQDSTNTEKENKIKSEFINQESLIIENLINQSLKSDFHLISLLKINYNKNILKDLIYKYLCKNIYSIYTETFEDELLHSYEKNIYFCAPKLSDKTNHDILGKPFYWCQKNKCFNPNIKNQLLKNCLSWTNYNLYHVLEIIGYPMIEYINEFPTTKDQIRNFIGLINRINKILPHLKCNSCGHLLFSSNNGGPFNDYHYFKCKNKQCKQYNRKIYINKCFNCSDIIDDRETKKCENNRCICKSCLSCCNDESFSNIVRRYEDNNQETPDWLAKIQFNGHNNRNIYFCYECGKKLIKNNNDDFVCNECNIRYTYKNGCYIEVK